MCLLQALWSVIQSHFFQGLTLLACSRYMTDICPDVDGDAGGHGGLLGCDALGTRYYRLGDDAGACMMC